VLIQYGGFTVQRILTFIGFALLLAIGVVMLGSGTATSTGTYVIPSDPLLTVVLVGSILAVLILTIITGIGMAQAFGLLSKQMGEKLDPADRPVLEKRAISTLDKVSNWAEPRLKRVGYGDSEAVAPYVPTYSYKAEPEQKETRQFVIGSVIAFVLLVAYAVVTQSSHLMEAAQRLDAIQWSIALGSIIVIIGAIGATGVGLGIWFVRTMEEKDKADKVKEPAWPAKEIVLVEQQIRNAPQTIKQMTFLDLSLIGLNTVLALIFLATVGILVVPGLITVAQVDETLNPRPTEVAQGPGGLPVSNVPEEIQTAFDDLPAGDAARGEEIFKVGQPCHTCHIDQPLGPPFPGEPPLAVRAATRRPGYPADVYIYESITHTSAYVVTGFQDGIMPANFAEILTEQDLADLVAYLMTQN
jgi:mono/diheme cytochrome c family protein